MGERHLDPELLDAMFEGRLPAHRLMAMMLRHLMDLCPACRQGFEAWQQDRPGAETYGATLTEVRRRMEETSAEVEAERRQAEDWLAELLALAPAERLARIRRARTRLRGRALAEALLAAARACLPGRPEESGALAEAAMEVIERSDLPGDVTLALEVQSRALAANAQRALGDLRQADAQMQEVRSYAAAARVADPLVRAEVDCLEGVLRKDQRRFDEAIALLNRGVILYQAAGEPVEAARALLALGGVYEYAGDPEQAARVAAQALADLDPEATPDLYLFARYNQAYHLHSAGRDQEAIEALAVDADLYERCRDVALQVRFRWLQGKLAAGRGERAEAERAFREVREFFEAGEQAYNYAIAGLDLALLCLEEGRFEELATVAAETAHYFAAQAVHPEALAAVLTFEKAAAAREATAAQIEWLARYLEEQRRRPAARRPPPAS